MGSASSHAEAADFDGGMHVLNVFKDSPAEDAGLEPYFDIIVAVNGLHLVRPNLHPCDLTVRVARTTALRSTVL